MNEILQNMIAAAAAGGETALRMQEKRIAREEKALRDFVTEADRAVEAVVAERVRAAFPGAGISGEEGVADAAPQEGAPHFVIDPIDGTTNYAWGMPHFGLTIALVENGQVAAGVVMDPALREIFSAVRGNGAWLNGKKLTRPEADPDPARCVFGAGLPLPGQVRSIPEARYHAALRRLMDHAAGVRRMGSSALSIAWVAAGRLDGFFEDGLSLHDYGAAALIAEMAGARVSGFTGGAAGGVRGDVLVADARIYDWLREGLASDSDDAAPAQSSSDCGSSVVI
ncbi:MAG: inositol monophosphatase family protein [Paracoccus sp. (in: a-proteobacteria)]|nr:inositol monophosphatase family protein [Paracoccus sp. (in: a-proteobacteria)]